MKVTELLQPAGPSLADKITVTWLFVMIAMLIVIFQKRFRNWLRKQWNDNLCCLCQKPLLMRHLLFAQVSNYSDEEIVHSKCIGKKFARINGNRK